MSYTEQDLRESLRRTTSAPPPAPNRVALVELAVRHRRRQLVVATVAAVVLALVTVPVVRLLPDRLRHNAIPAGTSPEQVDAMMKYATFVTAWTGSSLGLGGTDPDTGVVGVHVTWNLPPYNCTSATADAEGPQGTQRAWVLASPSAIMGSGGLATGMPIGPQAISLVVGWPTRVTSCDPVTAPSMVVAAPSGSSRGLLAEELAYVQTTTDPAHPALDVESVYRAIPADLVTDVGRTVFADYERARPDFGSETDQLDRVLTALGSWVNIALSRGVLDASSPVTGSRVLTTNTYVGTVDVPAGYTMRWDISTSKFCVQGSIGSSGVRRFTDAQFSEPGTPSLSPLDGPCS